jgi:hypothetical protein
MADVRSTESVVSFRRPFYLKSIGVSQPPGSYRMVVDETRIEGLSFVAYHRIATMLHIPAIGTGGATQEVYLVDQDELDAARAADALSEFAPCSTESSS